MQIAEQRDVSLLSKKTSPQHAPIVAHYSDDVAPPFTAWCGTRIMGIPTGIDAPLCVVCESLHACGRTSTPEVLDAQANLPTP